MQKRYLVVLLVFVLSLAARFEAMSVILPPGKTVTLNWSYPQNSQIVFNVYQTTNLAISMRNWTLVTNVVQRSCVLPVQSGSHFFIVAASNTVTKLESQLN